VRENVHDSRPIAITLARKRAFLGGHLLTASKHRINAEQDLVSIKETRRSTAGAAGK
jgi:hypothetical protein